MLCRIGLFCVKAARRAGRGAGLAGGRAPVSTPLESLTTRHQRFAHARLPDPHLTRSRRAFSRSVHHERHLTDAACGGLEPPPAGRLRRTYLHLLHSTASRAPTSGPLQRSWHTTSDDGKDHDRNRPSDQRCRTLGAQSQLYAGLRRSKPLTCTLTHDLGAPAREAVGREAIERMERAQDAPKNRSAHHDDRRGRYSSLVHGRRALAHPEPHGSPARTAAMSGRLPIVRSDGSDHGPSGR
jgi:hypothetical protein